LTGEKNSSMIKWEGSRKKNRCNITDSLRGHGDTCFVSRFIRQRMKIRWATPPTLTGKGWIWRPVGVLVYRRHNTACGITWCHFRYSTTVDERVKIGKNVKRVSFMMECCCCLSSFVFRHIDQRMATKGRGPLWLASIHHGLGAIIKTGIE
jgi:hypothetical protein